MPSTFETVAGIISETCDIPREKITPESHAINDLGIDSLDFLDVAFAIDKAFGIKMPLEQCPGLGGQCSFGGPGGPCRRAGARHGGPEFHRRRQLAGTDFSGRVNYLSAVAEKITGWTQADACGLPADEVFEFIDAAGARIPCPMTRAIIENCRVTPGVACLLRRRDGCEVTLELSAAPIHVPGAAASSAP